VCVPAEPELVMSGNGLAQWLAQERITLMHTVPSIFRLMVNECGAETRLESLKHVLLAGEPMLPSDVSKWYAVAGPEGARLVNLYGPSETTMVKFLYFVSETDQWKRTIPIGHPMSGAKAILVDEGGRPCPPGVAGQIYIRTPYHSLGYYGQPELTAQVFVPNPFSDDPQDIVYKTGDLARALENGDYELIGRSDQQIKIRGVRIEPGEIEAVLNQCKGVAQSVVVAREDQPGEKHLVAYVVAKNGVPLASKQLQSSLRERLPEYMVPGTLVTMEELPLTPNGKVDRHRLPQPPARTDEKEYVAPRTAEQEILCGIWEEVLRQERVGIEDNFFEIGGHSLLATQLVSRVRRAFAVELPLRALFESPTIAGMSERIEQQRRNGRSNEIPPLKGVKRDGPLPLSFGQQRLWFIDQLEGTSTEYNVLEALRLRGELDRNAMERAINRIVERHEILRTHFADVDGEPVQIVEPDLHIEVALDDLTGFDEKQRQERMADALRREMQQPFDLARGPLLRIRLLRLDEQEHIMLRTMHHVISDGWSHAVFHQEFMTLYEGFHEGREDPLPPLPIQYADFASWQRSWLDGEAWNQGVKYWKDQLAGIPEQLQLPTDRPRPAVQTFAARECHVCLNAELSAALKRLSHANHATLYMTMLSAFSMLMRRYSGQDDIVIGSPIANRQDAQLEQMIGFFVNKVVVRVQMHDGMSFSELLGRVRETTLEAYRYQYIPFERVVEEISPVRSLNRTPVFQVSFALQNAPRIVQMLKGLEVQPEAVGAESLRVRCDLEMHAVEREGEIWISCLYKRDLFDEWRIEQLTRHYVQVLEAMVADAQQPIERVDLLSLRERRQILEEWNAGAQVNPQNKTVHELFEEQVRLAPDAVAVVFGERRLTYAQLNSHANRISHCLHRLGVGPEMAVGIYSRRNVNMVIGVLATLKAGGMYVPLDLGQPKQRLELILRDARPVAVLTENEVATSLPEDVLRIFLDGDCELSGSKAEEKLALSSAVPSDAGAYILYTSGSTGRPKGVVVEHRQIVNYIDGVTARAEFPASASYAMVQPLAVDSSVTVLFSSLCKGGCLHVISEDVSTDPVLLGAYLDREQVDCLKIAPSHLAALQSGPGAQRFVPRRRLIVGGEASGRDWLNGVQKMAPDCAIFNHYGPTETTVGVLMHRLGEGGLAENDSPTVWMGRPLANTRAYVLDRHLEPVPVGVPGELYIAGAGLARGYLKLPGLTAERFVPDPYGASGTRMYRTGDVARWKVSGHLEFLGRTDDQVKIRGFRIELGEIEAMLRTHEAVQDAVVMVHGEAEGKRLVGYAVRRQSVEEQGKALTVREFQQALQEYLKNKLPNYMVPSALVILDALPLTPHGKLDRKALPRPDFDAGNAAWRAPRTPEEQILCSLFAEVLGVERVGLDDNFFELGGHSLLATRLVSRVRATLGLELPLRTLFEAPTVGELNLLVKSGAPAGSSFESVLPLRAHGSLPALFCFPAAGGLSWSYAGLMRAIGFERPIYGLQASGIATEAAFPGTMEELANDYANTIRRVQPEGPYHLLGWSFGGLVAHAVASRLQQDHQPVGLLAILDGYPRVVTNGPPVISEQELLRGFAQHWRFNPQHMEGRPFDLPTMIETARKVGHVLGSFEIEQAERMLRLLEHNVALLYSFRPGVFEGDLLLFTAGEKRSEFFAPGLWAPYIAGHIEVHEVTCEHSQMTDPAPITFIGRLVEQWLKRFTDVSPKDRPKAIAVASAGSD
jgi:amino acid adenylation domain-containing protein